MNAERGHGNNMVGDGNTIFHSVNLKLDSTLDLKLCWSNGPFFQTIRGCAELPNPN